ncbi:MAG: hypothetical protein KJZ85_04925 [Rhodobacteraceae bacterium]|jgi:multiple sugar transport system substrate-binding protein|nr:hypothetical protein [Paracoccaceae bacterium]
MTRVPLRGLTWDHPRAWQGLEAESVRLAGEAPELAVDWGRHSLRRFEEAALAEIAAAHDLVIFDHPFVGDAAASGAVLDLVPHAAELGLAELEADALGLSLASYRYRGGLWALPIDGACQTAAYRPDLVAGAPLPSNFEEAVALGRRSGLILALAVPHAFMNHLSICGLLGAAFDGEGPLLVDADQSAEAIEIQRRLVAFCPEAARGWSSIGALDALARSGGPGYCPLVFAFVTYARPDRPGGFARLGFGDPPGLAAPGAGTVIGGAGLGVSARTAAPGRALAAAARLVSAAAQRRMAIAGGQPGRASAWDDADAEAASGGFLSATRTAMAKAKLRPRFAGYIGLQNAAGALLLEAMTPPFAPARRVAAALQDLAARYWPRSTGRG